MFWERRKLLGHLRRWKADRACFLLARFFVYKPLRHASSAKHSKYAPRPKAEREKDSVLSSRFSLHGQLHIA